MNVLIVEDERSLSHDVESTLPDRILIAMSHSTVAAPLTRLVQTVMTLYYFDLGLPDMDGLELLKESKWN